MNSNDRTSIAPFGNVELVVKLVFFTLVAFVLSLLSS